MLGNAHSYLQHIEHTSGKGNLLMDFMYMLHDMSHITEPYYR